MSSTSGKVPRPSGDTGAADPAVTAALAAWARGTAGEQAALTALAAARLIVPVVALLGERDDDGAEKETEMALPTLVGRDGRTAVIAFTGTGTLARWDPAARPVPFPASRVWEYATAEGNAVVIDVAGPVPLVVEGARLAALAGGQAPPQPHADPDVRAEIAAVTDDFTLEPGPDGSDFLVTLRAADPTAARRAAEKISARVRAGGRFRRGVAFQFSSLFFRTDIPDSARTPVLAPCSRTDCRLRPACPASIMRPSPIRMDVPFIRLWPGGWAIHTGRDRPIWRRGMIGLPIGLGHVSVADRGRIARACAGGDL